jgi:ABC-type branched-subunit amino acid transport system ATPase component
VLFTEHDMDVVWSYADRVIVLDRGRIIAEGPRMRYVLMHGCRRCIWGDENA